MLLILNVVFGELLGSSIARLRLVLFHILVCSTNAFISVDQVLLGHIGIRVRDDSLNRSRWSIGFTKYCGASTLGSVTCSWWLTDQVLLFYQSANIPDWSLLLERCIFSDGL